MLEERLGADVLVKIIKGRDGRTLGRRALETRQAIIDALYRELENGIAWADIHPHALSRAVEGRIISSSTFYQYFESINEVAWILFKDLKLRKEEIPKHLQLVIDLILFEGKMASDAGAAYMAQVIASRDGKDLAEAILDEVLGVEENKQPPS